MAILYLTFLLYSYLVAAKYHVYTNYEADSHHLFQLHEEIASKSQEHSWDGTGLKLSGLFIGNETHPSPLNGQHAGHPLFQRSLEPFADVVDMRNPLDRRADYTVRCAQSSCATPGELGSRGFLTKGQQAFLAKYACGFIREVAPGVWATVGAEFANAKCGGGAFTETVCKVIISIAVERSGFYIGEGIQRNCDATMEAIENDCGTQPGGTTCTILQTGAPFGITMVPETDQSLTCANEKDVNGPIDCYKHTCENGDCGGNL